MAKCIYCVNIFLLKLKFKVIKTEEIALRRICRFIIKNYTKSWSSATNVNVAPLNDFIHSLNAFKEDDKIIAEACLLKFLNHLWYIKEEYIAFTVFSERIQLNI